MEQPAATQLALTIDTGKSFPKNALPLKQQLMRDRLFTLSTVSTSSSEEDDEEGMYVDAETVRDGHLIWTTAPNSPFSPTMPGSTSPIAALLADATLSLSLSAAQTHDQRTAEANNSDSSSMSSSHLEACEDCIDPFSGLAKPCTCQRDSAALSGSTATSSDSASLVAFPSVPSGTRSTTAQVSNSNDLTGTSDATTMIPCEQPRSSSLPVPNGRPTTRHRRNSSLDMINNMQPGNFQRWIVGFCVVTFDLELGHSMELIYPPLQLDSDLKRNVAFCAFPDSHAVSLGDTLYSFRVRVSTEAMTLSTTALARSKSSGPSKPRPSLLDMTDCDGYLYGYVLFRQQKDARLPRGYFQKSVVVLSKLNMPGLFMEVARRVGTAYFSDGRSMLEAARHNIASWPKPSPGKSLLLPLFDAKLQVEIPSKQRAQLLPRHAALNSPDRYILASIAPAALYTYTKEFFDDLWLCWELVLLCEPIMVLAKGPSECAGAVLSLTNLISPIPYGGDWRPYFTLHDSDFKVYSARRKTAGRAIVGVTNPFFKDAFDHWPNILRVGQTDAITRSAAVPARVPSPLERPSLKAFGRQNSNGSATDFIPGLTSKRKRCISRDTAMLKELIFLAQQQISTHILNDLLRRYFADLTERFLEPLDRYFATLIPPPCAELTTSPRPALLKPFRQDEFLKFVQERGTRLRFKTAAFQATACTDFYTQFLRCPNFVQWLQLRSVAAERRLWQAHIRALADADLTQWMNGRSEVALVDMLMRIRTHLQPDLSNVERPTSDQQRRLRLQADFLVERLPSDLKSMLAS